MPPTSITASPVHALLAATLAEHVPGPLFGLVGDGNLFFVDSFVAKQGGRYIAARHEASSVQMAIGYGQASGKLGVATVTHGPALANTAVALIEATKAGQPLLLIAGDTSPDDLNHLQKFDQKSFVAATGAGYVELTSPETASADLLRAIKMAVLERRPVVFNMRIDWQWSVPVSQRLTAGVPIQPELTPDYLAIEEAAAILAAAKRPIVLVGRGACDEAAKEALINLARRIDAPLATTLKASGLFLGQIHNLGIYGGLSNSAAMDIILSADTIIAFGAGLNKFTTGSGELLKEKRVVHVIADAKAVGRHYEPLLTILGSPLLVANQIVEMLDEAEIPGSGFAGADMAESLASATSMSGLENFLTPLPQGRISFLEALCALDNVLPADRTLVTDLGRFVTLAWRALPVEHPHALVNTAHFGAIGCGLHQAIGAAVAHPEGKTVLVVGDGGFALGGPSELATVIEHNLDLIIILCNDACYGAEHVQFVARNMDAHLSRLSNPSFARVAQAYGLDAVSVTNHDELVDACALVEQHKGPLFIELHADAAEVPLI
ncbi:thiamine pyrophosphate-dependent enzyme [Mesorhizobium sp. SB112]|uniref:thiamine pyrophosphate-binding protein n=1 Tax=Mesorhizobium sp. SB112 TaxID=3151853 RepID=UPI00326320B9